jgi:hypothetical protein
MCSPDIAFVPALVIELLSERFDVLAEIALLDDPVWPKRFVQGLLRKYRAPVPDQQEEEVEFLFRQFHDGPVTQDCARRYLHSKKAEVVETLIHLFFTLFKSCSEHPHCNPLQIFVLSSIGAEDDGSTFAEIIGQPDRAES